MDLSFQYIRDHGITTEAKYPYREMDQPCKYKPEDKVRGISTYVSVTADK